MQEELEESKTEQREKLCDQLQVEFNELFKVLALEGNEKKGIKDSVLKNRQRSHGRVKHEGSQHRLQGFQTGNLKVQ